jgi:hypothetical protein
MYKLSIVLCLSIFMTFTICYVTLFALYSLINYLFKKIVVSLFNEL